MCAISVRCMEEKCGEIFASISIEIEKKSLLLQNENELKVAKTSSSLDPFGGCYLA